MTRIEQDEQNRLNKYIIDMIMKLDWRRNRKTVLGIGIDKAIDYAVNRVE